MSPRHTEHHRGHTHVSPSTHTAGTGSHMSPHKHEVCVCVGGVIRVPCMPDAATLGLAAPCASVSPAQLSPEGHSHCWCPHVLPAPLHPQTTGSTCPHLPDSPWCCHGVGTHPPCLSFPTPPTHVATPPLRCRHRPQLTTQTTRCPSALLPRSPPGPTLPPAAGGVAWGGRPAAGRGVAGGGGHWQRCREVFLEPVASFQSCDGDII